MNKIDFILEYLGIIIFIILCFYQSILSAK